MSLLECLITLSIISAVLLPLSERIKNTAIDSVLVNTQTEQNYADI